MLRLAQIVRLVRSWNRVPRRTNRSRRKEKRQDQPTAAPEDGRSWGDWRLSSFSPLSRGHTANSSRRNRSAEITSFCRPFWRWLWSMLFWPTPFGTRPSGTLAISPRSPWLRLTPISYCRIHFPNFARILASFPCAQWGRSWLCLLKIWPSVLRRDCSHTFAALSRHCCKPYPRSQVASLPNRRRVERVPSDRRKMNLFGMTPSGETRGCERDRRLQSSN